MNTGSLSCLNSNIRSMASGQDGERAATSRQLVSASGLGGQSGLESALGLWQSPLKLCTGDRYRKQSERSQGCFILRRDANRLRGILKSLT